jgi:hypothetical protein
VPYVDVIRDDIPQFEPAPAELDELAFKINSNLK